MRFSFAASFFLQQIACHLRSPFVSFLAGLRLQFKLPRYPRDGYRDHTMAHSAVSRIRMAPLALCRFAQQVHTLRAFAPTDNDGGNTKCVRSDSTSSLNGHDRFLHLAAAIHVLGQPHFTICKPESADRLLKMLAK